MVRRGPGSSRDTHFSRRGETCSEDNLNTRKPASLDAAFPAPEARLSAIAPRRNAFVRELAAQASRRRLDCPAEVSRSLVAFTLLSPRQRRSARTASQRRTNALERTLNRARCAASEQSPPP